MENLNENIVTEETEVIVEEVKKENVFTKAFKGIVKVGKTTGTFMKNHVGGFVTAGVVIIGGVVYYLIKNGANEELVPVDADDTIDVTEESNIVEFDKAANE